MKIDCPESDSEKLTPYCMIQSIQKRHSNFMSALCPILAGCRFNLLLKLTPYFQIISFWNKDQEHHNRHD